MRNFGGYLPSHKGNSLNEPSPDTESTWKDSQDSPSQTTPKSP